MVEGFVCFGYFVSVFLFFDSGIMRVYSIQKFICEVFFYGVFVMVVRSSDQLMDGQCFVVFWVYFNWNLVSCIINMVGVNFDGWFNVVECFVEDFDRSVFNFVFNVIECIVDDFFCDGFFIVDYEIVYEFGKYVVVIFGVR